MVEAVVEKLHLLCLLLHFHFKSSPSCFVGDVANCTQPPLAWISLHSKAVSRPYHFRWPGVGEA